MLGLADRGSLQLETRPSGAGSGPLISPTAAKAIALAHKGNAAFGADPTDEDEEVLDESSTSSLDLEQARIYTEGLVEGRLDPQSSCLSRPPPVRHQGSCFGTALLHTDRAGSLRLSEALCSHTPCNSLPACAAALPCK